MLLLPTLINISVCVRPLISSHIWQLLEELTLSAYLIFEIVLVWFFASREQDIILSMWYIFQVTISSIILAYLLAIPFYLLCERPLRNFIDLILLPRSNIFVKSKDVDDEESSDDGDEDDNDYFYGSKKDGNEDTDEDDATTNKSKGSLPILLKRNELEKAN